MLYIRCVSDFVRTARSPPWTAGPDQVGTMRSKGGEHMYLIGMFSKINRITTKALRHYDEIGLLKPGCVDQNTGYRYYTSDQLFRLHRIMAYKQLGLTLEEIAGVLDDPGRMTLFLQMKFQRLCSMRTVQM